MATAMGMCGTSVARDLLLAVVLVVGAACGPAMVWSRPGVTVAERRRDEAECAAKADREKSVPVLVRRPSSTGGGSSDNIELESRRRFDFDAYHDCMESRGYRRVPAVPPAG